MAHPNYIQKTLKMKPEVSKIFEDLEAWHDHCRFELIPFTPSDLYRSKEYRDFTRNSDGDRQDRRSYRAQKPQAQIE